MSSGDTVTSAAGPVELSYFAICARGVEPLLSGELSALGITQIAPGAGEVGFCATLETAYRVCLWSRLATRVLQPVLECEPTPEAIYRCAVGFDWPTLFTVEQRLRVEVAGHSPAIAHSGYAALRLKDGVVDAFRSRCGRRPDSGGKAGVVLHLRLRGARARIALDLCGESLHRRGYRRCTGAAPLRETLAAAILLRAGWPQVHAAGGCFLDPMCGSGTLAIEAAWIAADIAPGLKRRHYALMNLRGFDAVAWTRLREDAALRRAAGLDRSDTRIFAGDSDPAAIAAAKHNIDAAGLSTQIRLQRRDLLEQRPAAPFGLLAVNPPYGERLGGHAEVVKLMSLLGATLKRHFGGWHAAVFTARADLAPRLGLRARGIHRLDNGPIACKLLTFEVPDATDSPAAAGDFANRLRSNVRRLRSWTQRSGVSCYRVYDADLPDYALAVDVYDTETDGRHVMAQEYAAPSTVDPVRAERRLRDALSHLCDCLELPASRLHLRIRKRQKGSAQYARQAGTGSFLRVIENDCRFLVNLDEYLDTGLFLDHRALRARIAREAGGKRFLNLFCYTGSATVHAARGGATSSVSVDLSSTYLDWANRNFELNGLATDRHRLVRADVRRWLTDRAPAPGAFDLILCDPPTFSNSKRAAETWDVRRDHADLLARAMALLAPGGTLYFSTNQRGFRLDPAVSGRYAADDISAQTLDPDFQRPPPPHRCWRLRHPPVSIADAVGRTASRGR